MEILIKLSASIAIISIVLGTFMAVAYPKIAPIFGYTSLVALVVFVLLALWA
jgi:NADH:ubiquinone oxidoreductase subunit 2 (subunit N)